MLSHTTTPRAPAVLYAQDKNQIFLTIDLQDVQEHELVKSDSQVSFKTVKDTIPYEFNLELFSKVDEKVNSLYLVQTLSAFLNMPIHFHSKCCLFDLHCFVHFY
jgi:hypothetical protein